MRFLRAHWTTIQKNPFDVYHYIALAPLSSIFQQVYASSSSFPHSVAPIGPDPHWPSGSVIQPHKIETQILSPCGSWLVTGGSSGNRPVFAVWDIQTADGITTSHPCSNSECSIDNVDLQQCGDVLELRTQCECEKICAWDVTTEPYTLLYEAQLESSGQWEWWADNRTKAISEQGLNSNGSKFFLGIFIDGIQVANFDLHEAAEGLCEWKFSPGTGDKIVGCSDRKIAVWEYSLGNCRLNALYLANEHSDFYRVLISPDTASILCTYKGIYPNHNVCILSSERSALIWDHEIGIIKHASFFPTGARILIFATSTLYVIRSSDGVHMAGKLMGGDFSHFSISPTGEKIAAFDSSSVRIIDSETFSDLQRHEWTQTRGTRFADISWKYYTLVTIIKPDDRTQPITFFPLTSPSSTLEQPNSSPAMRSGVHNLSFSPDGHHLFIIFGDGSVQLWCSRSGANIDLTGDYIEVTRPYIIEYTSDSSTVAIWKDFSRECLTTVDTASGRIKRLPLPRNQIRRAGLSPSSNHLVTIDQDDSVNIISFDGLLLQSLGKISSTLSDIYGLTLSLTKLSIAFTVHRKKQRVLSVFKYGMEPAHCHFTVSDVHILDIKFSPEGSHLFVITEVITGENFSRGWSLWMIRISSPMQKLVIGVGCWFSSYLDLFPPMKVITLRHRSFLSVSRPGGDSPLVYLIDCSDGRMSSTPVLCNLYDGVYYGEHLLLTNQRNLCTTSSHSIAYVDDKERPFVVDYSKSLDHM
jgi:hypothetical protein